MESELKFITGEPALKVGRALVVTDLHIGIEYRYRKDGIALPSQSEKMFGRLESLIKKNRAKRLIILGDVKHKVPGTSFQEEREVPAFFRRLLELVNVEVTPGNHDDGIDRLVPPDVKIHPTMGFMFGKTWLCHGHAWPAEEFLGAEQVVTGHNHAGIEFRDRLGYRWTEPVWIRAKLSRKRLAGRYAGLKEKVPGIILMPAFNEFAGVISVNRRWHDFEAYLDKGPRPLFKAARKKSAGIYMLDGTLLGELGKLG